MAATLEQPQTSGSRSDFRRSEALACSGLTRLVR